MPYFNRFQKQPAIAKLDEPFTPLHRSSDSFATETGSDLLAQ